jgi:hypothetical protein
LAHRHNNKAQIAGVPPTSWHQRINASTSTAWPGPGPGPTEDLLLPGSFPHSKEVVVSALAKASVWGKADKKKGVLLSLAEMRDTLLAKVGEASQGQKTTLEKWIPETERELRNQRFRASDVAEHLYEISIVFAAYRNGKPITRALQLYRSVFLSTTNATASNNRTFEAMDQIRARHAKSSAPIRRPGRNTLTTKRNANLPDLRLYVPDSLQGWFASSHFDSSSARKTHG